jgi:hypothetical protein
MMNKQEILKAIRVCAKKLGHNPSLRELRRLAGVNGTRLDKEFGSLSKALAAAGLEAVGSGFEAAESSLLPFGRGFGQDDRVKEHGENSLMRHICMRHFRGSFDSTSLLVSRGAAQDDNE